MPGPMRPTPIAPGGDALSRPALPDIMSMISQAPQGMPGAGMLNRSAGGDIMEVIRQLLERTGALPVETPPTAANPVNTGTPLPPEIMAQMEALGAGPAPVASAPPPMMNTMTAPPPPPPVAGPPSDLPPMPPPKARKAGSGSSPSKAPAKKKKSSAKDKLASDMVAADRVGQGDFVRKK